MYIQVRSKHVLWNSNETVLFSSFFSNTDLLTVFRTVLTLYLIIIRDNTIASCSIFVAVNHLALTVPEYIVQ